MGHNTFYKMYNSPQGFVTLISVVIVGAAAAAIASSVILFGLDAARGSLEVIDSSRARAIADGCAEEALQAVRANPSVTGATSVSFGGGGCTYTVIKLVRQARTVQVVGTYRNAVRKVQISITRISPAMIIGSWREVADF